MPKIMGREDSDVAELIQERLESEGVTVLTGHRASGIGHRAKEVKIENDTQTLVCDYNGNDVFVEFDEILVAVGRAANTSGFGLEELGVELTPRKTIFADEFLKTSIPTILLCRRCGRTVSIYPCGRASGLVCVGQRPFWRT